MRKICCTLIFFALYICSICSIPYNDMFANDNGFYLSTNFSDHLEALFTTTTKSNNFDDFFTTIKKKSNEGDPSSHYLMGMFHKFGINQPVNLPLSLLHNIFSRTSFSDFVTANYHHKGTNLEKSCYYSLVNYRRLFEHFKNSIAFLLFEQPHYPLIHDISELDDVSANYYFDHHKLNYIMKYLSDDEANSEPTIDLAISYMVGHKYIKPDLDYAIRLFKSVADANAEATSYIGICHLLKAINEKNETAALNLRKLAVHIFLQEIDSRNASLSNFGMALYYYLFRDSDEVFAVSNYDKLAYSHLKKSLAANHHNNHHNNAPKAIYSDLLMGIFYMEGFGCEPDHVSALLHLKKALSFHSIYAIGYLAQIYDLGIGTFHDCEIANELYVQVLKFIQFRYMRVSVIHNLINKNYDLAFFMLLNLAYLDHDQSYYNAASLLLSGKVKFIGDKATRDRLMFEFYSRAAERLDIKQAYRRLGDLYYYNIGVGLGGPDYKKALEMYNLCFTMRDSSCAFNIGYMIEKGLVEKNAFESEVYFYKKAIEYDSKTVIMLNAWILRKDLILYMRQKIHSLKSAASLYNTLYESVFWQLLRLAFFTDALVTFGVILYFSMFVCLVKHVI